jgi:hypothetical protein
MDLSADQVALAVAQTPNAKRLAQLGRSVGVDHELARSSKPNLGRS